MMRTAKSIHGFKIHASDGDIGRVQELLFDDKKWVIRYLAVRTGGWLKRKEVLLSPLAIREIDWADRSIEVSLTGRQVEDSPPIESDLPVSRQREREYFDYYRLPYYWTGAGVFGIGPTGLNLPDPELYELRETEGSPVEGLQGDPHLRTDEEVRGYTANSRDGEFGGVDDLIVDDFNWTVRYVVLNAAGAPSPILVSPTWVKEVSWESRCFTLDLTREQIERAPLLDSMDRLERSYEEKLHAHYGRDPYWYDEFMEESQTMEHQRQGEADETGKGPTDPAEGVQPGVTRDGSMGKGPVQPAEGSREDIDQALEDQMNDQKPRKAS